MAIGGLLGTTQSWVNTFSGWNPADRLPDSKTKGVLDNWTILCGPNDRTILMGPTLTSSIGANYTTAFDLVGYLISKMPAAKGSSSPLMSLKFASKLLFGYGDMKLAFGPSTSLLYGGPGGSSKRGPYWERIAGQWGQVQDAWGKGSLVSAEGSFKPSVLGKDKDHGLQFFERKQIFGEGNRDANVLGIMVDSNKSITLKKDQNDGMDDKYILGDVSHLDRWKKEKYEDEVKILFKEEEKKILATGDKAAYWGMIVVFILDALVAVMFIVYAIENNQGSQTTLDGAMAKVVSNKKSQKAREDAQSGYDKANEEFNNCPEPTKPDDAAKKAAEKELTIARNEMDKAQKEYDTYVNSEAQTTDPNYEAEVKKRAADLDKEKTNYQNRKDEFSTASRNHDEKIKKYEIDKAKKDKLRSDANAKKQKLEEMSNNPASNPESSETKRDLRWNQKLLSMRLFFKTGKILCLTVMETLENTEYLARCISENFSWLQLTKDNLAVGVTNQFLCAEKRLDNCQAAKDLAKAEKERIEKALKQIVETSRAVQTELSS